MRPRFRAVGKENPATAKGQANAFGVSLAFCGLKARLRMLIVCTRATSRRNQYPMPLFLSLVLAVCAIPLFPEQALAWGPGAHMVTGNWILQNLAALPPLAAAPLMLHPGQFLHGALSADIFIGKGSKAKKNHCHNWETGFSLAKRARTPREQAYAWGYLAHLAADTVAHNVFVPGLLHTVPGGGTLAHVYLEAQADRLLTWDSHDALGVFRERGSRETCRMLRTGMRRRVLPFALQSRLYRGSIALCGSRTWRASMRLADALLPEHNREALLDFLLALSARAAADVLRRGEDSPVTALDPIGATALAKAGREAKGQALKLVLATLGLRQAPDKNADARLRVELPRELPTLPPLCALTRP